MGARVVHKKCTVLHGGNYQVFCNNFFTTCFLFGYLLKQKIYAYGTARMDRRGFPETLKGVVLPERGKHVSCQRGNLVATVWQDKKAVKVLSTMSDPVQSKSVEMRQVPCPDAVVQYNKFMGGVDKGDQLRPYYCFRLKFGKNYKYTFWSLLDVAITNAHILSRFSPTTTTLKPLKTFRLHLPEQLIGSYHSRKRVGRPGLAESTPSTSTTTIPR